MSESVRGSEELIDAPEVARRLGLQRPDETGKRYVWRLAREGLLPSIVIGKYVKFDPRDVDAFIEERKRGPRRRVRAAQLQPRATAPRAPARRRGRAVLK
ncbi:MAG: helix-turn-helix domain-containing protein [Solirubrobacterales bacterium]